MRRARAFFLWAGILLLGSITSVPLATACPAMIAAVTAGQSGLLLAFDDGQAYCGTSAGGDTLAWVPVGNILGNAGFSGEKLVGLVVPAGAPDYAWGATDAGHVFHTTVSGVSSSPLGSQTIFSFLGRGQESVIGFGSDGGSRLYFLGGDGTVIVMLASTVGWQPRYVGQFPGTLPTPAGSATWGQVKAKYATPAPGKVTR
jgi:hypothetical protein